jgi:hypothetical protein
MNKLNYFHKKKVIISFSLELKLKHSISSKTFLAFFTKQIEKIYHVIITRAVFDELLINNPNLIILCGTTYDLKDENTLCLRCNNFILRSSAKKKLKLNHFRFKKSKKIVVLIGLESQIEI